MRGSNTNFFFYRALSLFVITFPYEKLIDLRSKNKRTTYLFWNVYPLWNKIFKLFESRYCSDREEFSGETNTRQVPYLTSYKECLTNFFEKLDLASLFEKKIVDSENICVWTYEKGPRVIRLGLKSNTYILDDYAIFIQFNSFKFNSFIQWFDKPHVSWPLKQYQGAFWVANPL